MLLLYGLTVFSTILCCHGETENFPLRMPNVNPTQPETYYCTAKKLKRNTSYYITEFNPKTESGAAHHILVYGCTTPGSRDSVWNCGEMSGGDSKLQTRGPCESGSQIVYAWAHNADKLQLPEKVAFKVGGDSPIKYLVLQVHYHDVDRISDKGDRSGVGFHYTLTPQPKTVGILLLGTSGKVKRGKVSHLETACRIQATDDQVIHPFAFRTHTHKLGTLVSGYKVQKADNVTETWEVIGKKSPQAPQMFYPIEKDISLRKGDIAAARCTMDATEMEKTVFIGSTADDEMCNFYMMYWVDGPKTLNQKYCFSAGPPYYSWLTDNERFSNIPDKDASTPEY